MRAAPDILFVQNIWTKRPQCSLGSLFRPFETPISSAPQGDRVKLFAAHHLEWPYAGHVALPEFHILPPIKLVDRNAKHLIERDIKSLKI